MPRKRPAPIQRLLFSPDPDSSPVTLDDEGGAHALQDGGSRAPPAEPGEPRPAPPEPDAPLDDGTPGGRTEDEPRSLEGSPGAGESGLRREPNRERGPGAGAGGIPGPFTARI